MASEAGIEGIYCAERENLPDEVIGVFESLIKKVLDLDHTRGIVMGGRVTSTIPSMNAWWRYTTSLTVGPGCNGEACAGIYRKADCQPHKKAGELKADGSMASHSRRIWCLLRMIAYMCLAVP